MDKVLDRHVISPVNPVYRAAIDRELSFWSHRRVMSTTERVSYPASHPLVLSYLNSLITGSPDRDWLALVNDRVASGSRAASLGSGIGFYERKMLDSGKIANIDLYELCPANLERAHGLNQEFGGRVRYIDSDLNFASLPENTYDVVLSRFFLHHIVNLEDLLEKVRNSLTPGGIFVLYDYIGESRYRWPQAKKQFVNAVLAELGKDATNGIPLGDHPGDGLIAPDRPDRFQEMIANSPFETIRSQDIPDVLAMVFKGAVEVETRYGALLHSCFRTLDFSDWERPALLRALRVFIDLDRVATRDGLFRPCGLFGIYRKGSPQTIAVSSWSEQMIRAELALVSGR